VGDGDHLRWDSARTSRSPSAAARHATLVFVLGLGAFGMVCAALVFTPLAPDADGTYTIGGIR
jgi:hypothetical protein